MTWGGTVQPKHGPFQNYVVSIFSYFYCVRFLTLKFLIVTTVVHATQLGWFINEAANALSHPPNSVASHSTLHAFTEVNMIYISELFPNVSLNYLYCCLFLCRGSARVLNDCHFTATALEPLMWSITFHHRLLQHVIHRVQNSSIMFSSTILQR
jgi:hypothetical protein